MPLKDIYISFSLFVTFVVGFHFVAHMRFLCNNLCIIVYFNLMTLTLGICALVCHILFLCANKSDCAGLCQIVWDMYS